MYCRISSRVSFGWPFERPISALLGQVVHDGAFKASFGVVFHELPAMTAFKSFINKNKWNESVTLGSNSQLRYHCLAGSSLA